MAHVLGNSVHEADDQQDGDTNKIVGGWGWGKVEVVGVAGNVREGV